MMTKEASQKRYDRVKQGQSGGSPVRAARAKEALWWITMAIFPCLVFTGVSLLFWFFYHTAHQVCYIVTVSFMGWCVVTMASDWNSVRGGKWYLYFGFMCFAAALSAMLCGVWTYRQITYFYYAMGDKRTYRNVLPTEPVNSVRDASEIYFAFDAKVDTTRSVGFKAQGHVYCIAPIIDEQAIGRINFWAAGFDCCSQRQGFECDGTWDRDTHGGAVILDELRPRLALADLDMFRHAARQAEAVYDLVSAGNPLFVRWMGNPAAMQQQYFDKGKLFLEDVGYVAGTVMILSSFIFSYISMKLAAQQAKEDRRRDAIGR